MKQKSLNKQLATACIMYLLFFSSFSYTQERAMEKLIKDSEVIIIGKVLKIESEMGADKNIWTYVTIECNQYLKGNKKNEVIIRIPGGEVGDLGQYVSDAPKYEINEEVLNFLSQDINGAYYVNGWEDGKYTHKNGNWIQKNSVNPEQFIKTVQYIIEQQSK